MSGKPQFHIKFCCIFESFGVIRQILCWERCPRGRRSSARNGVSPLGTGGSNPSLSARVRSVSERCPSGLRSTIGNRVCGLKFTPWVQIPLSPPFLWPGPARREDYKPRQVRKEAAVVISPGAAVSLAFPVSLMRLDFKGIPCPIWYLQESIDRRYSMR